MLTKVMLSITDFYLSHGDCLQVMNELPADSVDLILCDLPFGVTRCEWDKIIDYDLLWKSYKRLLKKNGVVLLFGTEPFSSHLRMSNLSWFKYDLIWIKDKPVGFQNSKYRPMSCHENISVFYNGSVTYNPQLWKSKPMNTIYQSGGDKRNSIAKDLKPIKVPEEKINKTDRLPLSYLKVNTVNGQSFEKTSHPAQKPVALLSYLIKTYSNKNDVVLDNCMGSGSTGVATRKLDRKFIGIELNEDYFKIAEKRIEKTICQQTLFD